MLQLPNTNAFVIITDRTSSANMKEVVDELAAKSWHVGTPYYMPVVPEP